MSEGTLQSGFVTNENNKPPRQCSNCTWSGLGSCGHPVVVSDPELNVLDNGRVAIKGSWCCNEFVSQGNAMMYCIRHGDTDFNSSDAFRGWIDVPLNEEGKKQATDAGQQARQGVSGKLGAADVNAGHICRRFGGAHGIGGPAGDRTAERHPDDEHDS